MIRKLMEFQTIILNYNAKSLIEPEIFGFFQHKVERVPHFARVSEVRHMLFLSTWLTKLRNTFFFSIIFEKD